MGNEQTKEKESIVPYFDFRKGAMVGPGTTLTGVKPQDLYTTQSWISKDKVSKALTRETGPDDDCSTSGYVHQLGKKKGYRSWRWKHQGNCGLG